ncbi:HesA/MoeB/ThiF family protein [Pelagovum pacificum]|uniref:Molybdopterin-synthase adenylyltransferase n=1 Tax=Pelagovum pacificum TaxID=2588711 RepID=A0A5C5GC96_9RHOB|nr:molybdopterin-synthase adenylyltransferase MoeB [Pelagovum pacificum]QQA42141.1 molybdopterin-synthase adenylyltransferase MoeB [Pelagovum pacificum]TNY31229.1 molybdopterin-synthase adenylyltransferase MoeB [Pelagovum pacificum]
MIVVLVMAATLWGVGVVMKAPRSARWTMIGLLLVAVLAIQVALPDGHALREATGGSPALWLLLLAFAVLVMGYRRFLLWVRSKAQVPEPAEPERTGTFSETELNRYARHMVLREIGGPGQKALKQSRVLVVGAGGLGSPALLYLAGAGVGTIGVIDDDSVDSSNLQRQVIHRDAAIGTAKVFSAQEAMLALNPFVTVRPYNRRLTDDIAGDLFGDYDLILEGSDNFDTRYLVNLTAAARGIPVIGAALTQWEGQISVWDPASGAPCYACVFPEAPDPSLAPSCAEAGVLSPLPGVVGSMMAVEAVKLLTDAGESLRGRLMIYDSLYGETRIIGLKRRADCPVCGGRAV